MYKDLHFRVFSYSVYAIFDTKEQYIDSTFRLEVNKTLDRFIQWKRNLFLDFLSLLCGGYPCSYGYRFSDDRAFCHFQFLLGLRDPDINCGRTWAEYIDNANKQYDPLDDIPF